MIGDASHLVCTGALEVVVLPIEGHKMWITGHRTCSVVDRIAPYHPLQHLAQLPSLAARQLRRQAPTGGAGVAIVTALSSEEGGSGLHIVTLVHAAALRLGDTPRTTEHKAVVTGTRLHTGGVAFCGSVCTRSGTAAPAELIVAVFWTLGCSCVGKETRDLIFSVLKYQKYT